MATDFLGNPRGCSDPAALAPLNDCSAGRFGSAAAARRPHASVAPRAAA